MIRESTLTLMFLVLAVSPLSATPLVDAGTHFLLPATQTQIAILTSGGDSVMGINFYTQIGDGGTANNGTDTKPIITGLDIVDDPRTMFHASNTGALPFSSGQLMWGISTTTDPNQAATLPATGTLALLTIDTAGTTGGESYALKLKGVDTYEYPQDPVDHTRAGLSTNFAGLTTLINDGQILISAGALHTPNTSEIQTIISQLSVTDTLSKSGGGTVILAGGINHAGSLSVEGGTLKYNFSGGQPVAIGIGATLTIGTSGTVELAGGESGLSDGTHFIDVTNNSLTGLIISGTNQAVGNIYGNGNTTILPEAELIVSSIHQNTLTIGSGAKVVVRPINFSSAISWKGGDSSAPTDWGVVANWISNTVPAGAGTKVSFGNQNSANNVVDMISIGRTIGSIDFSTTSTTIQSSSGFSLTLDNNGIASAIHVEGNHSISAPVVLNSDVEISGEGILNLSGGISGLHALDVISGNLFAKSINVNTLTIGSGAKVTIQPIAGGPLAGNLGGELYQVPEPNTLVLLFIGSVFILLISNCYNRNSRYRNSFDKLNVTS